MPLTQIYFRLQPLGLLTFVILPSWFLAGQVGPKLICMYAALFSHFPNTRLHSLQPISQHKPWSVQPFAMIYWPAGHQPLPKCRRLQMCLLCFPYLAKCIKCSQLTCATSNVMCNTGDKAEATYSTSTLVKCKQIQWVRIELKSPIQNYIPTFTPLGNGGGVNPTKARGLTTGLGWQSARVSVYKCVSWTRMFTDRRQAQEWIFSVR